MASQTYTVDLTNCDREPIHLIGSVQCFGMLIAVSNEEWLVTQTSRSVAHCLGRLPEDIIGRPLHAIFSGEAIHAIRTQLHAAILGNMVARLFGVQIIADRPLFDVAVHMADDTIVIECEPSVTESSDNTGLMVRGMIARLQQAPDLRAFYRMAAREMRAMTEFDRVMVYQFDQDGSGQVIAESARSGLEPYLGLRYPASDIPRQARILYERNWLRLIADVNATPSPIEPIQSVDQALDLSRSVLRSVSPIHVEYLRNMGVSASMSVSILRDGKLWGLFACHHYEPHRVSFGRRTAAELFGQMFSFLLENRERENEAAYELRAQRLHQHIVTVMADEATKFQSIALHLDEIADLLPCDGIALWLDGRAILKGQTPSENEFGALIAFLSAKKISSEIYACHSISAEFPAAHEYAERAAGMLVVPLSRRSRDYLVFFRKEVVCNFTWAGDPSKPIVVGPLGDRLTPRKSFELWKETVRGRSSPWLPVECRIAEGLRVSLLEVILHLSAAAEEERKLAQQRQELLIDELNHRVRNILSLIRGIITQSKDPIHTVDSFTEIIGGRVQALARAHDQITADKWGPASFSGMLKTEASAFMADGADRVVLEGPEILLEPRAFTTIALVIHEMITNSAKYGALSNHRGRVNVVTRINAEGSLLIDWSEQGGPTVKAPTRRGFGSTVIERSVTHDLQGEVVLDFARTGLRARFIIPSTQFRASPEADVVSSSEIQARIAPTAFVPKDVLLVEDTMLIALDTEDMMRQLGVVTVRAARNVSQALRLIVARAPDFALLDVHLGQETSFEIAERLKELGIRFAFATGYGEQLAFPSAFKDTPKLRKPFTLRSVRDILLCATTDTRR